MSWEDHKKRRDALLQVLTEAARKPGSVLPYAELPAVREQFTSPSELVLALQYMWNQALWGHVEVLSLDTGKGALTDAKQLAAKAWQRASSAQPVLRRLLDEHLPSVGSGGRDAVARQEDLIASAAIGDRVHGRRYVTPLTA